MNSLKAVILFQSVLFQVHVKENPIQTGLTKMEFMALITVKIQGVGLVSGTVWFRGSSMNDLISLSISVLFFFWVGSVLRQSFPCGNKKVAAAPAITPSLLQA